MAANRPWLSILIPVYNVKDYIVECIESITCQNLDGVEVIIVDDKSTDGSYEVLTEFLSNKKLDIPIIKHKKNKGLSAARNTLLSKAKGDYIWFIDSDDKVASLAINELQKIIIKKKPDLILCDFKILRENQKLKHRLRGENHVRTFFGKKNVASYNQIKLFFGLFKARNLHIWSKISKRELWGCDLKFPEGQLMEDMTVTPKLALRCQSYYYASNPWVSYRQRSGSILSTFNRKLVDDSYLSFEGTLDDWLEKYPNLPLKVKFAFAFSCIQIHLGLMRKSIDVSKSEVDLYKKKLRKSIKISIYQVYFEYIKRGWFFRLFKILGKI